MMAAKLLYEKEKIDNRPAEEQARTETQQAEQEHKQYVRNLLNYGYNHTIQRGLPASSSPQASYSNTSANGNNNFFSRAVDFFRGK